MTASQESIENEIKRSNCEENIVQGCQKVVTCPKNRAQTDTCMYYNVFLKAWKNWVDFCLAWEKEVWMGCLYSMVKRQSYMYNII